MPKWNSWSYINVKHNYNIRYKSIYINMNENIQMCWYSVYR